MSQYQHPGGRGGGGAGVTSIGGRTRCSRKKTRKKGIKIRSGHARNAKRVSKTRKMEENGIQIAIIRILAMRSNVERVGNLRQHVH